MKRDKIIQQTDNDASLSRMSAVDMGYLDDAYGSFFVNVEIPKRYPIINRGTYVRTKGIDHLVNNFLASEPRSKKQIISLGAGSDTRFFRLCAADAHVVYHELDFAVNTEPKITTIQRSPELQSVLGASLSDPSTLTISDDKTALYSQTLNIHPLDLRDLKPSSVPTLPNLDPDLPTLLLSECCLCYIPPETTTDILNTLLFLLKPATPAGIILYEPIRPNDSFGRVMISNLSSRGIELRTVKKYATLTAQRERLKQAGFTAGQGARSVDAIYYGEGDEEWVSRQERRRVEGLEWLDEVEEWRLLASHYCISWAWRGELGSVFGSAWDRIGGGYTSAEDAHDQGR